MLPGGFFLSKKDTHVCVGHFCWFKINEIKLLTELTLDKIGTLTISAMGTTINPNDIGLTNL